MSAIPYTPPTMHRIQHIHFVGIGGAGMSGIAEVLLNLGYKISGSDIAQGATVQRLQSLGAQVFLGHKEQHIENADVVVVSSAVKNDNPEVVAAHKKLIPVVARAVMLAELMRFRLGIAVAGTHGKTTTTSLLASILAQGELDPTVVIGGRLNSLGTNARLGTGQYLVAEADESDGSFLNLQPIMAIVTNIDADHLESYNHDFNILQQAFIEFLHKLPFYGLAVVCVDDAIIQKILPDISRPLITYGLNKEAAVRAEDIKIYEGKSHFKVYLPGACNPCEMILNLPGKHNVLNALASIAIAHEIGVSINAIQYALEHFSGVGRRLQVYGNHKIPNGKTCLLIDDYGHHPKELAASFNALFEGWPDKKLAVAFQPHRYSRTQALLNEFIEILTKPYQVFLTDIYAASEAPIEGIHSQELTKQLPNAIYCSEVKALPEIIAENIEDNCILLCLGAGSIGQLAPMLSQQWEAL